ncbi:hypothetical protein DC3_32830 [Deinococcus cellulosilyticus NBRC 106333 = KACC 11606]|uniref:Lipoprotein n=1 Tax=Deinococcus cellulosilyticus (strain DSM 18568 / NBRC 106333 / KACC 11606 / 5516J-15) TaxID=1223518 RepID=A0A511N588_DEIC1|nr:hypothetical protein DC3_32830 [Deinococcus cellulosilyticus NBRC 106333 = KACC 11606]
MKKLLLIFPMIGLMACAPSATNAGGSAVKITLKEASGTVLTLQGTARKEKDALRATPKTITPASFFAVDLTTSGFTASYYTHGDILPASATTPANDPSRHKFLSLTVNTADQKTRYTCEVSDADLPRKTVLQGTGTKTQTQEDGQKKAESITCILEF